VGDDASIGAAGHEPAVGTLRIYADRARGTP
jgi:hypothetical protein